MLSCCSVCHLNEMFTIYCSDTTIPDDNDPLFESLVVLEEFCKELAAIAFVKYHHGTLK